MFTLPPLPPKDYVLRDVNQNQRSCQEFTPVALPRVTQSNLRKFCAPVQYQENETLANLDIDYSVNPQVLERWTNNARAFWVDKPGKNDYFLHDMCKKYTVEVVPSYDVRFKHNGTYHNLKERQQIQTSVNFDTFCIMLLRRHS
jgi:hypothetical protein